jgi:dihydrodipicolinate synthase/N-acetylneuraminate lyase
LVVDKVQGIIPALSTVTDERGELDEPSLRSLVQYNTKWGVHALAVSIIAGEFYKFSDSERRKSYDIVVQETNGRVPVWAGISHMGTAPAVQLGRYAKDIGANGVIAMTPIGVKTGFSTQWEHFDTILDKVDLPLMLQDAEDFSGSGVRTSLFAKLSKEHSNLVSVKVEGGDILQKIQDAVALPESKNFTVIGGMAARFLFEEIDLGAQGNIPDACLTDLLVSAYDDYITGKKDSARATFARYKPWVDFMSLHPGSSAEIEKETLKLRGIVKSSHTRSPHIPLDEESKKELTKILQQTYPD